MTTKTQATQKLPPELQAEIDALERDIAASRKQMRESIAETNVRLEEVGDYMNPGIKNLETSIRLALADASEAEREATEKLDALMLEEAAALAEED